MNAIEYLKGLNEYDPIFDDTSEEYEYTEHQLINFTERYHNVVKHDLGNHLAKVIKQCSAEMKELKTGSVDWTWLASKKTLAESILIQFC